MRHSKAFTLIELLIVVAIIAILAAIAVPNFLEAQTRSKVSRVKADLRTVATAVESYGVDNNAYPLGTLGDLLSRATTLTTPISYLTSVSFKDPFNPRDPSTAVLDGSYLYYNYQTPGMYSPTRPELGSPITQAIVTWRSPEGAPRAWLAHSLGPDQTYDAPVLVPIFAQDGQLNVVIDRYYDPTNGTISAGDITRFGGDIGSTLQPN